MTNAYQEVLKITAPPRLEQVKDHPEASSYSLLIAALIERGGPMTLSEVAERFAAAGVATADEALAALRRCRPARPPVHRDGEHYSLDPHHDEADLWAFRLGLRPPKVTRVAVARPEPPPLPGADVRLTAAELDEAWKDASLNSTSARQVALAVLDAHGGPMPPDEVVAAVRARTRWHALTADSTKFKPRGSPIEVDADGRWAIVPGHAALGVARTAVRDRIAASRRAAQARPDPAVNAASMRVAQEMRDAHAAELAQLRRVILYGFPEARPEALALLDVGERTIATFLHEEIADVPRRLAGFDVIAGIDVRGLLRGIGVDPSGLRLAELGPAQKTMKLNKRGRTLKITAELLIQGSCGISRPFAPDSLRAYLDAGDDTKARRRLEADVKSLYALHEYGRLHHTVRLRWGFLDERLPAPWVHHDEPYLGEMMEQALMLGVPVEVVVGGAPGWADPWSRAIPARVVQGEQTWDLYLVDQAGIPVHREEIQLARLAATVH